MKKTVSRWIPSTVVLWNGIYKFGLWYGKRIGFWDYSDLLGRHHSNNDLIKPPADL
jgi:hypothetical protein